MKYLKESFLSVPLIFDDKIIKFYESNNKKTNNIKVKEVYGSIPKYTARESSRLPKINLSDLGLFTKKFLINGSKSTI